MKLLPTLLIPLLLSLPTVTNACTFFSNQVTDVLDLGDDSYQITMEVCQGATDGFDSFTTGFLLDMPCATILDVLTPTLTSTNGVSIDAVFSGSSIEWGDIDDLTLDHFIDSDTNGGAQQCFTLQFTVSLNEGCTSNNLLAYDFVAAVGAWSGSVYPGTGLQHCWSSDVVVIPCEGNQIDISISDFAFSWIDEVDTYLEVIDSLGNSVTYLEYNTLESMYDWQTQLTGPIQFCFSCGTYTINYVEDPTIGNNLNSITVTYNGETQTSEIGADVTFEFDSGIPCAPSVSLEDQEICAGSCAELLASGNGTPPITYEWDNDIPNTDGGPISVCPIATTTYTVIMTDSAGVIDTASAVVTVIDLPDVDLGVDLSSCGEDIVIDAQNVGYEYLWQDGSTDQLFTADETGTYWVEVSNQGCSDQDTIFVSVDGPLVNLGPDQITCHPDQILNAENPDAIHTWQDGSNNQTFSVSEIGTYWVVVNDGGCITSDTIVIQQDSISINTNDDMIACSGSSVVLEVDYDDGNYSWNTGENSQSISVNSSGVYTVIVNEGICYDLDSVVVDFYHPEALFNGDPLSGCSPLEVSFNDSSSSEFGVIATWEWNFGDGGTSDLANPNHTYDNPGFYDVSLVVRDNNTCENTITYSNYVEVFQDPAPSFYYTPEYPNMDEPTIQFINETENTFSWYWLFGDGLSSIEENPEHIYSEGGIYMVTLYATNQNGCINSTTRTLYIETPLSVFVPNSFTPNNDGINDVFYPVINGLDETKYELKIYDRWGEVVFQTLDYKKKWDGGYYGAYKKKADGSNYFCEDGVYSWTIDLKRIDASERERLNGHVLISR